MDMLLRTFRLAKNINGLILDNIEDCFLPPILDKDPSIAVKSMTIEDSEKVYLKMKESYEAISKGESKHLLLEQSIMYNYYNFMWFASYFRELEKVNNKLIETKIPYDKSPEKTNKKVNYCYFQPPIRVCLTEDKRYRIEYIELYNKRGDIVNFHRTIYICNFYEFVDFPEGYPSWYTLNNTIVYEKYNPKINKRVKVVYRDSEFRYYIAGASDKWEEILNVPLEIDDVIASIIFRN